MVRACRVWGLASCLETTGYVLRDAYCGEVRLCVVCCVMWTVMRSNCVALCGIDPAFCVPSRLSETLLGAS